MKKNTKRKIHRLIWLIAASLFTILCYIAVREFGSALNDIVNNTLMPTDVPSVSQVADVPEPTDDTPYVIINSNIPLFTEEDLQPAHSYEYYSDLDSLGRCQYVMANIGTDLMPTEPRESIGMIKPSGWNQAVYEDIIPDKYLWNRCHLIGYQLTAENANELNLITGTRYMNTIGMLPFENEVADYLHNHPENHVLYRVTPDFRDSELVARGVLIEAQSIEDNSTLQFCVYVYNIQPGIIINYQDGSSQRKD